MKRVGILRSVGSLLAFYALGESALAAVSQNLPDAQTDLAARATMYALPLVIMDVTREQSLAFPGALPNRFFHKPTLGSPTSLVVRPNVDTLYSSAWLNVDSEPMILTLPPSDGRFFMVQCMDAWTNVFADPGTRTLGDTGTRYAIVGPNWSGDLPGGFEEVRTPTPMVWVLARVYVRDQADLSAARIYQKRLDVRPLSRLDDMSFQSTYPRALPTAVQRGTMIDVLRKMGAEAFFERFRHLATVNPADPADPQLTQTVLLPFGLASAGSAPAESIAGSESALLASGFDRVLDRLGAPGAIQQQSRTANGWSLPGQAPHGSFGTNYLVRAIVATWELAENLSADTIYFNASTDRNGARLDGIRRYRLTFGPGKTPPARAFWSVTVYDNGGRLVTNPSNRYAVSSGENLVHEPDGSLSISLQPDDPGPVLHSNWLPTSPGHTYGLSLRCYWPDEALLGGQWIPPPVMPID